MLSVSSLDIASIKVVICIQASKSMEIMVAGTANSPLVIYSSLSPCWWLVARRLRLVASWLVARSFCGGELVGGEIPWWRGDRNSSAAICQPIKSLSNTSSDDALTFVQ